MPSLTHGPSNGGMRMRSKHRTRKRTLALFICLGFCLGLATPSHASHFNFFGRDLNEEVRDLDDKRGRCPCFNDEDLARLIADASSPMCTYNFNADRRLRIFDDDVNPGNINSPEANAFTRASVACFGPRVRPGNSPGLPPVGGYAIYNEEGKACRDAILRAANKARLECVCLDQNGARPTARVS
jgi:hypothetical protein